MRRHADGSGARGHILRQSSKHLIKHSLCSSRNGRGVRRRREARGPTRACCGTPAATPSPTRGTTPGRSRDGSGTGRSPAPLSTQRWRRTDSRIFGGIEPSRRSPVIGPPLRSLKRARTLSRLVEVKRVACCRFEGTWLRRHLAGPTPTSMVVLPTGFSLHVGDRQARESMRALAPMVRSRAL
jgi:hypothetical protein